MPTRKVGEVDRLLTCDDPDHNPSSFQIFPPGRYAHACKSCGRTIYFTVYPTFLSNSVQGCQDTWREVKRTGGNWFGVLGLNGKNKENTL